MHLTPTSSSWLNLVERSLANWVVSSGSLNCYSKSWQGELTKSFSKVVNFLLSARDQGESLFFYKKFVNKKNTGVVVLKSDMENKDYAGV